LGWRRAAGEGPLALLPPSRGCAKMRRFGGFGGQQPIPGLSCVNSGEKMAVETTL